jgi:nucleoside-diphosphate-sugar epimerase
MIDIAVFGSNGFVGSAICRKFKKNKIQIVEINRQNYSKYISKNFNIIINSTMPAKRFWAKKNPELDYKETVVKTKNIISDFKFKKIIHISSVSARCQLNTIYGNNKKKSEDLIRNLNNYLIIRLGPLYGKDLLKGVLIDMIQDKKVFIDGKTKYSFTDVDWNAEWIMNNLNLSNEVVEIGATDYIQLDELSKLINSKSKFEGDLDDQIIQNRSYINNSSMLVLDFIKKIKNEIHQN